MKYMHTTIESARTALETMVEDANADGFNADGDVDVVYGLLLNLEMDCRPDVRAELWQVELGIIPSETMSLTAYEVEPTVLPPISDRAKRIAEANRVRARDRRKV